MRTFWIVAIVLLLWNLMGDAAYLMQAGADLDALAESDPVTAEAFAAMPAWAWSAYAVAVWVGTAAALALLARRKVAAVLFAVSLAGVVVQFGWSFLGYGLIAKKGASTVVFPLVIATVGAFSVWYASRKAADGTLR
ncbi:sugar transporter [Novosphingobium sp. PC22D]|uniref:sugar transporter n=1 Tax=Novosphingobium sp. PC22D TaxID=1962403 RepID=UPI000BF21E30|nr:sugar transporter [Novosphingobium sp. PC22D]PEQ10801.1 sugar transporter [Novosphingobium sp. PC22D]